MIDEDLRERDLCVWNLSTLSQRIGRLRYILV